MLVLANWMKGAALAALMGSTTLAQSSLTVEGTQDAPPVIFEIVPQVDTSLEADLMVERLRQFASDVSLRVRRDPSRIPSAALVELVSNIAMVDGNGVAVSRGYDIDAQVDLVLGYSGGSAQILSVQGVADKGLEVVAVFRDQSGRVMIPPPNSVSAYRTDGERLCLREEGEAFEQAPLPPMSFAILLDTSGSMRSVMDDLRLAAHGFLNDLPDTAQCYVGAFNEDANFSRGDGLGEAVCSPRNFSLSRLQAAGGTNLYDPMRQGYAWLNSQPADHQRAMIIISDGAANRNQHEIASLESAKGNSVTFVYFLGAREERWLRGMADNYLHHEGSLAPQLEPYFEVVSSAYAQQTVLQLGACESP
ncbi:MAG: VWA domain-containing protein [Pseudomonadota bacterium]